jgi:hypothetical protein
MHDAFVRFTSVHFITLLKTEYMRCASSRSCVKSIMTLDSTALGSVSFLGFLKYNVKYNTHNHFKYGIGKPKEWARNSISSNRPGEMSCSTYE